MDLGPRTGVTEAVCQSDLDIVSGVGLILGVGAAASGRRPLMDWWIQGGVIKLEVTRQN